MRVAVVISIVVLALSTSAHGQTSSRIAAEKPADTYSYFKRTLARLKAGTDAVAKRATQSDKSLSLRDCWGVWDYIGYDDQNSITQKAADLAYDVLFMQAALETAGYPNVLWESDLAEYERTNLANISEYEFLSGKPARERLAKKLNDYKKALNKNYKNVTPDGECGGGEVPIVIRTIPRAQRVQYINLIKYELCSFQGLEPTGPLCDRWVDYSDKGAEMAGKYKVFVTWSDGSSALRDLNVDDLFRGRNGDDPTPFVIRKQ
jgi:hypothetical protein